ncbi:hypothetical protein V8G54_005942 [Vigna mungo]|uniref:Uncharacterized protein n=1 Tax=Vigna mungo TaxID=3915 RepID=A0AAQ3NZ50_VIGMU
MRLDKEVTLVKFNSSGDHFFMPAKEKVYVHRIEDARILFELECSKLVVCAAPARWEILHIDFGDCFEASMNREKFPKKVGRRIVHDSYWKYILDYEDEIKPLLDVTETTLLHFCMCESYSKKAPGEVLTLQKQVLAVLNEASVVVIIIFSHLAWVQIDRKSAGLGELKYPLISDITKSILKSFGVLIPDKLLPVQTSVRNRDTSCNRAVYPTSPSMFNELKNLLSGGCEDWRGLDVLAGWAAATGSVKSGEGFCVWAAGIAGLLKLEAAARLLHSGGSWTRKFNMQPLQKPIDIGLEAVGRMTQAAGMWKCMEAACLGRSCRERCHKVGVASCAFK